MYRSSCLFFLLTLLAAALSATTIVMPTDDQLIDKSPVIIEGLVLDSSPVERNGGIWTETQVAVTRAIKGDVESTVVIREVGGRIGDRMTVVFGSPEYVEGEKVLLFLWPTTRGDYQTNDLFVGKFTEKRGIEGKRYWFRPELHANTLLLDEQFREIHPPDDVVREAARFVSYVEARATGGSPRADYFVPKAEMTGLTTSMDFTLISEPTIYRWFAFEKGTTIPWRHYGAQPGYSDGGVAELKTGMSSWTSYSAAKILYSHAGATSTAGGLSTPNGVNEVLFDDPLNEISGTWTGSGGGVVGRGGFNNAKSGGSWTSPFAADSSHPQKTYSSTWDITEGNLVIQDGVSPSTGISSSTLAAILAHEFGHTLGFGHSAESNALMYATVSGGPSLRSDDQLAARWLYPSGSSSPSPTVPAAPSNLTASAISTSQAQLSWIDNASDETAQNIYIALGSGSFSLAATVGANVTSATIGGLTSGQTYRFQVTALNSVGESSGSNIAQTTMPAQGVQAAFTYTPSSGTAGVTTFSFFDQSTGPVASRSWSFGDGTSSTASSPNKMYSTAGTYTVRLTVTSTDGSLSSTTRSVIVSAPTSTLTANFSFSPASPTTDQSVSFTDQSAGGPSSWSWSFGDGTTSTLKNPSKRYSAAGTYSVRLTVSDGSRTSSSIQSIQVTPGAPATPPVTADFLATPSPASVNQSVSFQDRSSGSPTSWTWSFGNGQTSTLQNPAHAFAAPGDYHVTLTVRNSVSTSSATKVVTVKPGVEKFTSLVPVSAQTTGAGSSYWRTELTIFNAGTLSANVELIYIPAAGGLPMSRQVVVTPNAANTWQNVLPELFGISSGTGAIGVEAASSLGKPDLKISSRTFTTGTSGTYGQFVPDVADDLPATMYLTGIDSNQAYRTNVGLVNRSVDYVESVLTLYDGSGHHLGSTTRLFGPRTFQQFALTALFPALTGQSRSGLSLRVSSSLPNAVTSYISVIDNRTQDPVFMPAIARGSNSMIVPAVARIPGAAGTFWRSDLTMLNPTTAPLNLTLRLWIADRDNRGAGGRSLTIGAGQTIMIGDVLSWLGAGDQRGALEIITHGSTIGPIVTSRSYTTRSADGGTYGQWIPAIESARFGRDGLVTGLKSDTIYRSNLGFVNSGDQPIGINLTLVTSWGQTATAFLAVQPRSQAQASLQGLFPQFNPLSLGNFTIRAHTDNAATLFAYGSVIDNQSGDPIFIAGQ
ncbi:MAG TPA: PKD domain-containing protein [Thermoanaerobaculia bacterium]|nr:PKD domain-containing protein [Thermoanaerobaculia bacterium]